MGIDQNWMRQHVKAGGSFGRREFFALCDEIDRLRGELAKMRELAKRAIGDHFAPNDCYATGPLTGDRFRDLVECPACSLIAALAEGNGQEGGA